jgi:flagella basal body P-ring formation protein FlgA
MILPIAFALAACLVVAPDSDHILARDLVDAFPPLAAVAPQTEIALAPAPGVTRVFRAPDLRMLAAHFHLGGDPNVEPFCFTRPVAQLDAPRLLAAMKQSLPAARIEILDFTRQPAPEGDLEFPIAGLHPPEGASGNETQSALLSGSVRYGGARHFAVWAKVRVLIAATRVLAIADLRPGHAIAASQLSAVTDDQFPSGVSFAQTIDQVAGRWPRLAIRAGSPIRTDRLEEPKAVMRGETVRVQVHNGAARLDLDGVAELSGSVGEFIPVLNPSSRKRFRARVEGDHCVSVDVGLKSPGGIS